MNTLRQSVATLDIPLSCLPSGSPTLHSGSFINLREIFEYAHLKFTVYGRKQTSMYVRIHTQAVLLVWGSLRLVPNSHMYPLPMVWPGPCSPDTVYKNHPLFGCLFFVCLKSWLKCPKMFSCMINNILK